MPDLPDYTIKTYRYLRMARVIMLVLLGAGVLIERVRNRSGCFQPSISDYYYTPAQAVFVASLGPRARTLESAREAQAPWKLSRISLTCSTPVCESASGLR